MAQKIQTREESIKQLRNQLAHLTSELNKTTEHIQLLELQEESRSKIDYSDFGPEQEIVELLQKQNTISHEIILVKKRIQKLSAKTILKIELLILPIVIVLLVFVAANYVIVPPENNIQMKTRYIIEDLRGESQDNLVRWEVKNNAVFTVNIYNDANADEQKIHAVRNAIMSTETIVIDSSKLYHADSTGTYFRGWQGALQSITDTKHYIPENFSIIQDQNGEGSIVITLSAIKPKDGYFGVTRTIANGNQILKTFITIYGADKLTNMQIESILRHEFGHALGLPYTDNTADLMYESLYADNSYISECDVKALQELYDNMNMQRDFCSNV